VEPRIIFVDTPAGKAFALNADIVANVVIAPLPDPSRWPYDTFIASDLEATLYLGGAPSPVAARVTPGTQRGTWTITFPNPGGGGWAADPQATLMVRLSGYRRASTRVLIATSAAAGNPAHGPTVTIASPPAGSSMTYPLSASGSTTVTGMGTAVLISQTGGQYPGTLQTGAAPGPWVFLFNGGPTTECTLKATNSAGTAFAQEDLNPPPGQ
jgi:hypothetical protein